MLLQASAAKSTPPFRGDSRAICPEQCPGTCTAVSPLRDGELLPVFNQVVDRRGFDGGDGADEQAEQEARHETGRRLQWTESPSGCGDGGVGRVHISVGSGGFLQRCKAADVILMSVR